MNERTFSLNGLTITVKRSTIDTKLDTDLIMYKLGERAASLENSYKYRTFARFVARSTVEGSLGFEWPSPASSEIELRTAYENWRGLDEGLFNRWDEELALVSTAPNAPAHLPPDELNEGEKKVS